MLLLSLARAVGMLLLRSSALGFEAESSFIPSGVSRRLCFLRLKSIGLERDCVRVEATSFSFCNPKLFGLLLETVDLGKCLGFELALGFIWIGLDGTSLTSFWASRVFCLATISLSFWLMDSTLLSVKQKHIATISHIK